MKEYIIVGDTEKFKDCLIYTCGVNKSTAEKVLNRILTNPTKDDLHGIKGHTNIRIKEVESEKQWWNQGGLD